MKTKELIEQLQKSDPSGELQVSVGKTPIYLVERTTGWYDGTNVELIQDHSKDPYYNIIGFKFNSKDDHLTLHTMSWRDVLLDHPNCIVEEPIPWYLKEAVEGDKKINAELDRIINLSEINWEVYSPKATILRLLANNPFRISEIIDMDLDSRTIVLEALFELVAENKAVFKDRVFKLASVAEPHKCEEECCLPK